MRLSQIIAVEKDLKSKATAEVTALHRASSKPELFEGFTKTYVPKDENSESYPPERKLVQMHVDESMQKLRSILKEVLDIEAVKDLANTQAVAEIVVDGKPVLGYPIPTTLLLFLEKQMNDIRTFVEALPVLDPSENWTYDPNTGGYRADPTTTHRTKKTAKAIVKYPATEQHPAQTEMITEDVTVGHWSQIRHSGAMALDSKVKILERVNKLARAIKEARAEANSKEVSQEMKPGSTILSYIFSE